MLLLTGLMLVSATWAAPKRLMESRCCAGGGRCLEVLTREDDPEALKAACAAALGADALADVNGAGAGASCGGAGSGGTALGIKTEGYAKEGWWARKAPDSMGRPAPLKYLWGDLGLSSEGCVQTDAMRACRDKGLFEEVDLFVAFQSVDQKEVESWAALHPWKGTPHAGNVRTLSVRSIDELHAGMARLRDECKVVRHAIFDTHGVPGNLRFEIGRRKPFTQLFLEDISPCAFAPGARIQFVGCNQACGKTGELIHQGLNQIFTHPKFQPAKAGAHPWKDLRLLLNTSYGIFSASSDGRSVMTFSSNDVGAQYTVKEDGHVTVDEKFPACDPSAGGRWAESPELATPMGAS